VITQNDYHHRAFSRITKEDFDWEGDTSIFIDPRDLIIYELHLRDFTAHPSSDLADSIKGSYLGLIEKIGLFKDLGVNAVELLPVQEFANLEVPYNLPVAGWFNSWNPYACNYWGTAPDYFFTPEAYYASGESLLPGEWSGLKSDPVRQFKEMVKALHKQGLAVIMQMVYDHTSQYDLNPLKYVDKKYYYNLDQNNECLNHSGYGDDLNTSRPMVRRLMMDSLKRWIRDFHIDGFQFNSANMIDKETLELVLMELRRENPEIILIAEAGAEGKENLAKMSDPGFSVLNNLFANTIRGQNPEVSPGFIFGEWSGGGDMELVKSLICGNSISAEGDFQTSAHTVNYLEVHNGYTLGDFIRIGSGEVSVEERITNIRKNNRLSKEQGALNRLAALILLVSRGAVMVIEGQEYARSKVIVPTACPDPNIGRFDHNSYNKDNFTNWINYDFRQENNNLVEYYRKLIKFRKNNAILRYAGPQDYRFFTGDCEFSLGFQLEADSSSIIVLINANQNERAKFTLPTDNWKLALAEDQKLIKRHQNPKNSVSIEQVSGVILYLSR
jgi:pullulanase/glycogen debranching enzyme